MSLNSTTDCHTLTIKVVPVITQEQVCACLEAAFTQAVRLDPANRTTYLINMVEKRGVRTGRGFVRVGNSRVYHMLLGSNPDGSSRVVTTEDPNWVEDSSEMIFGPLPAPGEEFTLQPIGSWADEMEEEERRKAPLITTVLPPLISLMPIALTEAQRGQHDATIDDPNLRGIASITPRIEAAQAHDVEIGLCHNVLRSSNLLPFMSEDMIKKEFAPYSTSFTSYSTRVTKNGKHTYIQESYPVVRIQTHQTSRGSERVAYVTFDSSTRDASFAFHMMRCRKYTNSRTNQTFIVSYTYAKSRPS